MKKYRRRGNRGGGSSGAGTRDWNARSYDRVGSPMTERGLEIAARVRLRGDETVMDAGCGTGRVTEALLERLRDGRVIALDGSASMLEVAGERFGADPRVELVRADLTEPLPEAVPRAGLDAIVSTSTFHWISDHEALFANLATTLKVGGLLAVDCGGAGNAANVIEAMTAAGELRNPWNFASIEQAERRLNEAGFDEVDARLVPRPAVIEPDQLEEYLATVVLGTHLESMGEREGAELAHVVAEGMPEPIIDYVRLQFTARRAA